jgi:hypothetical protein
LPSSQLAGLGVFVQLPVATSQTSSVQSTPSLQSALVVQQPGIGAPSQLPPAHASGAVQSLPSLHIEPSGQLQLSAASLQQLLHCGPPAHGSPTCLLHVPPPQESAPLQNTPSGHGVPCGALLFWHVPDPLQVSAASHGGLLAGLPQAEPAGLKQLSAASLHRLLHCAPPTHGSPVVPGPVQAPATHESVPLQNTPSTHPVPSIALLGLQTPLPEVSGLVHSLSTLLPQAVPLGVLGLQTPAPLQVSARLQGGVFVGLPQAVPAGSKQLSVPSWQVLHSVPGQGSPG